MELRGLALLLALASLAPHASAQAPPAPAQVPQAIPLASIAERADALANRLRELEPLLAPDPALEAIRTGLAARAEQLRADRAALAQRLELGTDLGALEEARRPWRTRQAELAEWRRSLTERASAIDAMLGELAVAQETWSATRRGARRENAPEALVQAASQALGSLSSAIGTAAGQRGELLTLQSRVADLEDDANAALERIAAARSRARTELLVRDQRALWESLRSSGRAATWGERLASELRQSTQALAGFAPERRGRVVLATLFGLAVLGATLSMRPRVREWAEADPEFASTAHLFERPLSTALVSALLLLLVQDAPAPARALVGAALLVPALRVLSPWVPRQGHGVLYALAGLYVVDRVRDLLAAVPLLERGVLALELAAALACLLWLLRPARLAALPRTTGPRPWLGVALRAAAVVLAAALAFVITGWVALGRVLGEGVLRSAYLAFALLAASAGLQGLLRAALQVRPLRLLHLVQNRRASLLGWSRRLISLAATLGWVYLALGAFAADEVVLDWLGRALTAELQLGELGISLGDVLGFAAVVGLGLFLARALREIVDAEITPRATLPRGVGYAIGAALQYAVALFVFFFALGAAGIDASRLALFAGALSVGVGFGLQNVVNNFVSGLILLIERPIQVGDWVEAADLTGEVKRIGIRSSTVRTGQGAEVILPNSSLISERVVNWTMSDRHRRIDLAVGVAYGSDPERVLEILEGIARAHPGVLAHPRPQALFLRFGESALEFELRVWTGHFEGFVDLQSQLAIAIYRELGRAGIAIPFPQRDLHLRSVDPEAATALARARNGAQRSSV
jgi:small-conductance mechanosensitive channel